MRAMHLFALGRGRPWRLEGPAPAPDLGRKAGPGVTKCGARSEEVREGSGTGEAPHARDAETPSTRPEGPPAERGPEGFMPRRPGPYARARGIYSLRAGVDRGPRGGPGPGPRRGSPGGASRGRTVGGVLSSPGGHNRARGDKTTSDPPPGKTPGPALSAGTGHHLPDSRPALLSPPGWGPGGGRGGAPAPMSGRPCPRPRGLGGGRGDQGGRAAGRCQAFACMRARTTPGGPGGFGGREGRQRREAVDMRQIDA